MHRPKTFQADRISAKMSLIHIDYSLVWQHYRQIIASILDKLGERKNRLRFGADRNSRADTLTISPFR